VTRKDYVAIASRISRQWNHVPQDDSKESVAERIGFRTAIEALCDCFAADNSRFDKTRFLTACNLT
jgi:hypothetical protein